MVGLARHEFSSFALHKFLLLLVVLLAKVVDPSDKLFLASATLLQGVRVESAHQEVVIRANVLVIVCFEQPDPGLLVLLAHNAGHVLRQQEKDKILGWDLEIRLMPRIAVLLDFNNRFRLQLCPIPLLSFRDFLSKIEHEDRDCWLVIP